MRQVFVRCSTRLWNQVSSSEEGKHHKTHQHKEQKRPDDQVGCLPFLRTGLRDAKGHDEAVYDTIKPFHRWIVTPLFHRIVRIAFMQNFEIIAATARKARRLRFLSAQTRLLILLTIVICLGSSMAEGQAAPPDFSAPLSEARGLVGRGDYAGADAELRTLLKAAPELPEAHFLLGFALLHEQKPAESLAEYTQGAKFRAPGPEELLGVALDYIQLKDLPDAEKWLTAAAKSAPERPLIWYLLGRTQYEEKHGGNAERSLLTCLRLDPQHLRAKYNLGLVYELLKRPEEAAVAYRAAIAMQESATVKDPEPYLDLGMMLRREDKAAEALPLLKVAAGGGAGGGSKDPVAYRELGLTYEQLGRYDEAVDALKMAISLTPKVEALHFFLGRLYREAGHRDEAAREFAEAAKLSGE
jgi:tetratricopeptide (TPR) repeat protein